MQIVGKSGHATMLWLGCFAFLLFFISDLNDCRLKFKPLVVCFPLGGIALSAATVISCITHTSRLPDTAKLALAILGLPFLLLLISALFFAIPADEAYVERKEGRAAATDGLYALCRHPGVLFFIPLYICISFAFGLPFYHAAIYSLLNIFLIVYEDIYVFPKVLFGYAEYKKTTPFLIPNRRSIKRFSAYCKKRFGGKRKGN